MPEIFANTNLVLGLVICLIKNPAPGLNPDPAIFLPAPRGFMTLLIIMLFIGSVQFFILAILGEYMARIFEEVKQRPKYIIKEILNPKPNGRNGTSAKNGKR